MDSSNAYISRNEWLCLTCNLKIRQCECVTDESLLSEFSYWIERNFYDESDSHTLLFGTLTFGGFSPGRQRGRRALESFRKLYDARTCKALYVEEFGHEKGRLHYHFLAQAPKEALGEASLAVQRYWTYGHHQVAQARSGNRTSRYVAKYLAKDYGEGPHFEFKEEHLKRCERQMKLGI